MFVIYSLLNQKDAQFAYTGITKWFKENLDRESCITETFTVRRNHIKEDILKNSVKRVILKDKVVKKKVVKKKSPAKKVSKKKTK